MGYLDSMCLYSFVNNNPVCYTDPFGLYTTWLDPAGKWFVQGVKDVVPYSPLAGHYWVAKAIFGDDGGKTVQNVVGETWGMVFGIATTPVEAANLGYDILFNSKNAPGVRFEDFAAGRTLGLSRIIWGGSDSMYQHSNVGLKSVCWLMEATGTMKVREAIEGQCLRSGEKLDPTERWSRGIMGGAQMAAVAYGASAGLSGLANRALPAGSFLRTNIGGPTWMVAPRVAAPIATNPVHHVRAPQGPYPKGLDGKPFNPSGWRAGSTRYSPATGRAWKGGTSMETPYTNVRNGTVIYRHTIIDKHGRIIHDHFRPYSKPSDFGG